MIEIFKTKENINPPFMREIFCELHVVYNLRNYNELILPRVRTTIYRCKTIKYRKQRLWFSFPQHIRNAQSINEFKKEITSWNADYVARSYHNMDFSNTIVLDSYIFSATLLILLTMYLKFYVFNLVYIYFV